MSFPIKVMLLLVGTIVCSYVAKAELCPNNVNEVVNLLHHQNDIPLNIKAMSLTVQLRADSACPVGELQKVAEPLVALIETAPSIEDEVPAWVASLGSPCKELMSGVEKKDTHIHGIIGVSADIEKLMMTMKIAVHHEEVCDEQIWTAMVHGCTDFLIRCVPFLAINDNQWMVQWGEPLHQLFANVLKVPLLHLSIQMEYIMHDDTHYAIVFMNK